MTKEQIEERPPPIGGGPLGLGDPDDLRLRKSERDIILPKMMREEALKRCSDKMKIFADCAKENGILVSFLCKEEHKKKDECVLSYAQDPAFVKEITDKYLNARSYYRRTGQPLEKYVRRQTRERTGLC